MIFLYSHGIPVSFICKSDKGISDQTPTNETELASITDNALQNEETASDVVPPNGMLILIKLSLLAMRHSLIFRH
jgi:hypothetical protein